VPRSYAMTWVPSRRLWRRVYRGQVYQVSIKQLREAGHQPLDDTKEGSRIAANAWWAKTEYRLGQEEQAARRPPVPLEDVVAPLLEHLNQTEGRLSFEELMGRQPTEEDRLRELRWGATMLFQLHVLQGVPLPPEVAKQIPFPTQAALASLKGQPAAAGRTVQEHADRWLQRSQARVQAGQMTAARHDANRSCLRHLVAFLGAGSDVEVVNAQAVDGFYLHCLSQVTARRSGGKGAGWSVAYARDVFAVARAFVRYLYEGGLIERPRNLDSRNFDFGSSGQVVKTWTAAEFGEAAGKAGGRMKTALLLMANCGMTSKDVADLLDTEVDWDRGRVTRKRSKTRDRANVPTVNYKLWPATFEMLKKYRSGHERVLLTKKGLPYVRERMDGGRTVRSDGFRSSYRVFQRRLGFKKTLKYLRKTGASLLNSHPVYGRLTDLYLGHAPKTMAERHYAAPPQELFDEAVTWLGRQLGQVE
jgi:integrase